MPLIVEDVIVELDGRKILGEARLVSSVGMFFRTEALLGENDVLNISFMLPGSESEISCVAEVIWKRRHMPGALYEQGTWL